MHKHGGLLFDDSHQRLEFLSLASLWGCPRKGTCIWAHPPPLLQTEFLTPHCQHHVVAMLVGTAVMLLEKYTLDSEFCKVSVTSSLVDLEIKCLL